MIVADASVTLDVLLALPGSARTAEILLSEGEIHVPHVLDLEVIQALRRLSRIGELNLDRALQAISYLGDLPLTRHSHASFRFRIWELRNNMTAYDAAYVSLAESLDAPLLTRDKKLASAPGHRARIELV